MVDGREVDYTPVLLFVLIAGVSIAISLILIFSPETLGVQLGFSSQLVPLLAVWLITGTVLEFLHTVGLMPKAGGENQ